MPKRYRDWSNCGPKLVSLIAPLRPVPSCNNAIQLLANNRSPYRPLTKISFRIVRMKNLVSAVFPLVWLDPRLAILFAVVCVGT